MLKTNLDQLNYFLKANDFPSLHYRDATYTFEPSKMLEANYFGIYCSVWMSQKYISSYLFI